MLQFGYTPPTGTARDGRNRNFDVLMGANFADGKGNVTAYLSYRHADPIESSQRDYGACELNPIQDAHHDVIGVACGGSSNSNLFMPVAGPGTGTAYSVNGHSFVPWGTVATTPPAIYNGQTDISLTREDDRYNAAIMAHEEVTDVAMTGLANVDLDADLGSAPSILRLFAPSGENQPSGLTSWDAAFLKALYQSNQTSRTRRFEIAVRVLHDISR